MDGTITDSAEYHWIAWRETMTAEGRPLSQEAFLASFGQRNDVVLRGFFGPDLPDAEVDRIGDDKEARYRELVREGGLRCLPGVERLLASLGAAGWRQAVASSAPRANVEAVLAVLGNGGFFDALVAGEDVRRGKPDPEVFLLAASRLGVPPAHCVVVEDAPAGIEAARRAGMRSIGVLTSREGLDGDLVVATLDKLPEDAFSRLLDR